MIHQYKLNGYNIVLDVDSGAIHLVDDLSYDMIAALDAEYYSAYSAVPGALAVNRFDPAGDPAHAGISVNEYKADGRRDYEESAEKGNFGVGAASFMFNEQVFSKICTGLLEKYSEDPDVTEEVIREIFNEIRLLVESGRLFTYEDYAPLAGRLKERSRGIVKALCLHVAHSCNLNCAYCFASQGKFNGERALMSFETGKRALDFLVENSGIRRNLEVDFFGGEPLMNWQVVKDLVAYARSIEGPAGKNFRFTLTTNGMLIDDDVIDFANRECHNVVLSLDGRKNIHDAYRVDYNGKGSWDCIVPKFQRFVEKRGSRSYYMRGTFTHNNPDFLEDIKEMLRLGFAELSMEPVVCAPDDPVALTDADIEIVKEQYEKLAELMIERDREGRPFTFYHYMIDLGGGPCIYKRLSGCGSGTEYMAVTPWGDLYPCHQFVGDESYKLGDIWKGVENTALTEEFANCNVYSKKGCADCWAKLYCAGGCAANNLHASGSINGIYKKGCELFKKRLECAIMLAAARSSVNV